jgi:hypothetical protein
MIPSLLFNREKNLYSRLRKTKIIVSGLHYAFFQMRVNHNSLSTINPFVIVVTSQHLILACGFSTRGMCLFACLLTPYKNCLYASSKSLLSSCNLPREAVQEYSRASQAQADFLSPLLGSETNQPSSNNGALFKVFKNF